MPLDPIFKLDKLACVRGGAKAGQYLQDIGQTDLGKLNTAQFEHFCHLLVGSALMFAMDDYINTVQNAPPF